MKGNFKLPQNEKCSNISYMDGSDSSSYVLETSSVKSLQDFCPARQEHKYNSWKRKVLTICLIAGVLLLGLVLGIAIWRGLHISETKHSYVDADCTSSSEFRCSDGWCIRRSRLCDGSRDCSEGEDESGWICSGEQGGDTDYVTRTVQRIDMTPIRVTPPLSIPSTAPGPAAASTLRQTGVRFTPSPSTARNTQKRITPGSTTTGTTLHHDSTSSAPDPSQSTTKPCTADQYTCPGPAGLCIPLSWVCDGGKDCPGGEDELPKICNGSCQEGLANCADGYCILLFQFCDHIETCPDGSDERNCIYTTSTRKPCTSSQFTCTNGSCIPIFWLCDGIHDCSQGEDEVTANCQSYTTNSAFSAPPSCSPVDYRCHDGVCISNSSLCDGERNCMGSEDEDPKYCNGVCRSGLTRCIEDGTCIFSNRTCDRNNDCPRGSDEKNCNTCDSGAFRCNDGKCIPMMWTCDEVKDCTNGEDEALSACNVCHSSQFQCAYNRTVCIESEHRCDGNQNCMDGSDEAQCFYNGANGQVSPGNSNTPLQVIFKNQMNYSLCSSNWDQSWSDALCKEMGYRGASAVSFKLDLPSNGKYLILKATASTSNTILSSVDITGNCASDHVVGLSCNPLDCGLRNVSLASVGPYMINGEEAARGAWPWQVSLRLIHSPDTFGPFCAGSLINDRWVVTAAHCLIGLTNAALGMFAVQAGTTKLDGRGDPDARIFYVNRFYPHPQYYFDYNNGFSRNDIGLVRLAAPVTFTETIRPVCLPSADVDLDKFKVCVATGWGRTRQTIPAQASTLRQGKVKLYNEAECRKLYTDTKHQNITNVGNEFNNFFCAGESPSQGGVQTCNGDSGGPLSCQDQQNIWTIVGATSFGDTACTISFYTRISNFLSYINSKLNFN